MLKFYVSKNGELMSGEDKDLILQTSKGIDIIKVHLPEDYDDNNIVASITFKNPKNVNSNEYKMEHVEGSKVLTYLLDDAWFSSVKGTMQFTIRVYSTDVNLEDSVQIDPETGDIIADMQSKVQVFTKGSYQILEAVNKGVTPEIPEDDLEKIYAEITKRASKAEIYAYVEKVVGVSKTKADQETYKTIDYRLTLVEQDLKDDEDIVRLVEQYYLSKDKTIDVLGSDKPLTIIRKNSIGGDKEISISLPTNSVLVDMDEETHTPAITFATQAQQDQNGDVIDTTYVKINTSDTIIGKKTFAQGIKSMGVQLTPSSGSDYTTDYNIRMFNIDPYAQLAISGVNEDGKYGHFYLSLTDGYTQLLTSDGNIRFYLKDLLVKETPIFKDIEIKSGPAVIAKETIPYLSNRNILCVYNGEILGFNVVSIKDSETIVQTYGTTIEDLTVEVTKIIRVGDLSE